MFPSPLLSFLVEPLNVVLELLAVDPPDPAAADLYGRQLAGADERIHLRHADAQVGGHSLLLLMSSSLVILIFGVARQRLLDIVSTALSSVCGGIGC